MLTLNCHGKLIEFTQPIVMGILNVTPDSFFPDSRKESTEAIRSRVCQIKSEGGLIIDVGAYSSRPGAEDVSPEEEMSRLRKALPIIKEVAPELLVSVDTFRADVSKMCVEEYGVDIINDISAGQLDREMYRTVARLRVPYILTHLNGTPHTMQDNPQYAHFLPEVFSYFAQHIQRLRELGLSDIILDPGFGFGKLLEQNYELLAHLSDFREFNLPLLVGISRKSMIYKLLDTTPNEALNGTSVLHAICLMEGADILRAHDVREAVETIKLYSSYIKHKETDVQL